jgi:hypothetical protein
VTAPVHGGQTPATGIHGLVALEFPNATDRGNFANEVNGRTNGSEHIGKVARQLDDGTLWAYKNNSPITWTQIDSQGTTDHGALGGLGDDDHTQYHNDARGDARYFQKTEHVDTSAGAGDAGKPVVLDSAGELPDTIHGDRGGGSLHAAATGSVAGFMSAADKTKLDGIAAGAESDHGGLTGLGDDDHTQYSLADGTRAFTGAVGGVTPTTGAQLATKDYVDSVSQGIEWQDSVFDRDLTAPPGSPSTGDRYIVASGGTGAWSGQDDAIAEWDGAAWQFTTPTLGMTVAVDDENRNVRWNGSAWAFFGTTIDHGNLAGLGDNDHPQYQLGSEKGNANGYAALDGSGDVPLAQLPVIDDTVHGNRGGGALHAAATTSVAGFMSAGDKTKLDNLGTIIRSEFVSGDQMGVANANFPVTNIQPTDLDNTYQHLGISVQDDVLEEIKWWSSLSPGSALLGAAANRLFLQPIIKPQTAPGVASTIGLRLYYSNVPFNAAVPAWQSIDLSNLAAGDFNIPTNIFFQQEIYEITIGGAANQLDITPGEPLYLGLARINPSGGTELTGVSHLFGVGLGWAIV